jgi:hypothetical protein
VARKELRSASTIRNDGPDVRSNLRVAFLPLICGHAVPANLIGRLIEHVVNHVPKRDFPSLWVARIVFVARDEPLLPVSCERHRVLEVQVDAVTALGSTKGFNAPFDLRDPFGAQVLPFALRRSRRGSPPLFPTNAVWPAGNRPGRRRGLLCERLQHHC